MWIDQSGVAHTVALPDPTALMDAAFTASVNALRHSDPATLKRAIEDVELRWRLDAVMALGLLD